MKAYTTNFDDKYAMLFIRTDGYYGNGKVYILFDSSADTEADLWEALYDHIENGEEYYIVPNITTAKQLRNALLSEINYIEQEQKSWDKDLAEKDEEDRHTARPELSDVFDDEIIKLLEATGPFEPLYYMYSKEPGGDEETHDVFPMSFLDYENIVNDVLSTYWNNANNGPRYYPFIIANGDDAEATRIANDELTNAALQYCNMIVEVEDGEEDDEE